MPCGGCPCCPLTDDPHPRREEPDCQTRPRPTLPGKDRGFRGRLQQKRPDRKGQATILCPAGPRQDQNAGQIARNIQHMACKRKQSSLVPGQVDRSANRRRRPVPPRPARRATPHVVPRRQALQMAGDGRKTMRTGKRERSGSCCKRPPSPVVPAGLQYCALAGKARAGRKGGKTGWFSAGRRRRPKPARCGGHRPGTGNRPGRQRCPGRVPG